MHGSDFETREEKEVKVKLMPITKVRVTSIFDFKGAELIGLKFLPIFLKFRKSQKEILESLIFPKNLFLLSGLASKKWFNPKR